MAASRSEVGQCNAGTRAVDQRRNGGRGQLWLVLVVREREGLQGIVAVDSSSLTSASPIGRFDNNVASKGKSTCPGWSGLDVANRLSRGPHDLVCPIQLPRTVFADKAHTRIGSSVPASVPQLQVGSADVHRRDGSLTCDALEAFTRKTRRHVAACGCTLGDLTLTSRRWRTARQRPRSFAFTAPPQSHHGNGLRERVDDFAVAERAPGGSHDRLIQSWFGHRCPLLLGRARDTPHCGRGNADCTELLGALSPAMAINEALPE